MKTSFNKIYNGFQWIYSTDMGDELSIILHDFSYGNKFGLFESMASWEEDVEGFLSFEDIQEKIVHIYKLEKQHESK